MNLVYTDFIYTIPLWGLVLFSFLPLLIKGITKNREMKRPLTGGIAFLGFTFSALALIYMNPESKDFFSGLFRLDSLAYISTHILICMSLLSLPLFLSKSHHIVSDKYFSEYIFLFMNSVVGLILLAWSNHLLTAFISIEYFSLCFYLMIPLSRDRNTSIEAALKYFILGSVAAAFFLLGICLIYISIGSFDFSILFFQSEILAEISPFFLLGFALVCAATLFKVALFPFQFWLPDVYQGSPTPLTGFMAGAVKVSVFIFLLKIISEIKIDMMFLFQWLAVLTLIVGHVSALFQKNLKRMLIYSSLAHAGYIMMVILHSDLFSVSSLVYYLIFYSVTNLGALTFVMFLEKDQITGVQTASIKGLYKSHLMYAFIFMWFLLNLAGFPPTAGFFAKVFILESLIQQDQLWMVFWLIIGSVVSLYYYLRPCALMFMGEPNSSLSFIKNFWVNSAFIIQFLLTVYLMIFVGNLQETIIHFLSFFK